MMLEALIFTFIFTEKVEFREMFSRRNYTHSPLICDLNLDGKSEIIFNIWDKKNELATSYHVSDARGNTICQLNFPRGSKVLVLNAFDILGGAEKEIFFSVKIKNKVFLTIRNIKGEILKNILVFEGEDKYPPYGLFDGNIGDVLLIPRFFARDEEEVNKLALVLRTSFDLNPRGIFIYELEREKISGKFLFPGIPYWVFIKDYNKDGVFEIYGGTFGPCNGAKIKGYSDCESYVFAIDEYGKVLWIKKTGGESTISRIELTENFIYACELGGLKTQKIRKLYKIEPLTGKTVNVREFDNTIEDFEIIKKDNIAKSLFLAIGNEILILSPDFEVKRKIKFNNPIHRFEIIDIEEDGKKEFLVFFKNKVLKIYNENFKEMGSYYNPFYDFKIFRFKNYILNIDKGKKGVLLYSRNLKKFIVLEIVRYRELNKGLLYFVGFVSTLLIAFFAGVLRGRKFYLRTGGREEEHLVSSFIHELRNSLSFVKMLVQKKRSEEAFEEISRIEKISKEYEKFLSFYKKELKRYDITEFLNKKIKKWNKIAKGKIKANIERIKGFPLIPEDVLDFIVENLLSNAFSAIREKGEIEVRAEKN